MILTHTVRVDGQTKLRGRMLISLSFAVYSVPVRLTTIYLFFTSISHNPKRCEAILQNFARDISGASGIRIPRYQVGVSDGVIRLYLGQDMNNLQSCLPLCNHYVRGLCSPKLDVSHHTPAILSDAPHRDTVTAKRWCESARSCDINQR